jgi:hypothetical protein
MGDGHEPVDYCYIEKDSMEQGQARGAEGGRVRVRHSKGGAERFIPLNAEGAKFFASLVKGK